MTRGDKRDQIMQAAETLFTSRRFHEITLDEVAQAAHVGKGTIYRYFKDKDDLFFQTATKGSDDLYAVIRASVPEGVSFEDKLLAVCEQVSAFYRKRREILRMIQDQEGRMPRCGGEMRRRWSERRENVLSAVASVFRDGVEAGQVRSDIAPEVLAGFLLGALRARVRELASHPGGMPPISQVVDFVIHGAVSRGAKESIS
ncbi:TetR/AcrR family transcriptional regulator [Candidatus Sumerlaeota bacterium]|nr:TetR/AcrR family transcriptional regulator [Candidatus Sumerlaeota bacterium]